jgi:serine/threonine-protein kinase
VEHEAILKDYTVSDPILLKKGGQKSAYRVVHPIYGVSVVKIGNYKSAATLERARREVLVQKEITSEYYPKNYEFKVLSPDTYVLVEEYIESIPLSQSMGTFNSIEKILKLIKHISTGLKIIWDKRIVHRDIKPDNILITSSELPKIIDLGIARLLDFPSLTHSLARLGPCTPIYAAPEQLTNRKTEIDQRTDQFSLGIVMVQLSIGGHHPFDPHLVHSGESIVHNILEGKWCEYLLENSSISIIKPLAKRLLGREPFQRYRNSDILLFELEKFIEVSK